MGVKYEGGITGGYGCRKYTSALHCAIGEIKGVSATEYELFIDQGVENGLKREITKLVIQSLGMPDELERESIVPSPQLKAF